MKHTKFLILFLALLLFSSGCGAFPQTPKKASGSEKPEKTPTNAPEPPAGNTKPEAETSEDIEPEDTPDAGDTAMDARTLAQIHHAYGDVLSGILQGFVLPDGTPLEADDYSTMDTNQFAITDVDGDGRPELVFCFSSTYMANMISYVWEYDPHSGDLVEEFFGFPALTFYENGLLQMDASHNHSLGFDLWPYSLFQYEEASDTYTPVYRVSSWEKEIFPEDYNGEAFPDASDADGDGIVYLVSDDNLYFTATMDNRDFESWSQEVFDGAKALELPWENLTFEAISFYMDPYLEMIKNDIRDTATDKDLAYLYLTGEIQAIEDYLSTECGVTITALDEYGDFFSGTLNGQEVISFDFLNASSFTYTEAIDGVTVLGITPGMKASEAVDAITALGFKPDEGIESCYVTGRGLGNYGIYMDIENGVVTGISFSYYCRYAG